MLTVPTTRLTTSKKGLFTSKIRTRNQKKENKKSKTITTILKSFVTVVFITTTSSSIILSPTGIALIVIPKTTASACGFSFGNMVIHEVIINKYNKHKKQYKKINKLLHLSINYTE